MKGKNLPTKYIVPNKKYLSNMKNKMKILSNKQKLEILLLLVSSYRKY